MNIGQPSRQVLRRATLRARRLQRSLRRAGHGITLTPLAMFVGWSLAGPAALASPTGGQVVGGSAQIANGAPGTLNIFQQSERAIINWQGFSIAAGETVNFVQPSAGSVTLNRVLGNDPSAIFGRLNANGTVMLVNPNGIVFGASSRVDVGGLIASTANIRDNDFMAGRYEFTQASPATHAAIENAGHISVRDAGLAALVAPRVRNSGVIEARLGRVALGAANTFTLDFHGDGLLSFGAGSAITEAVPGSGALVTNSGEIRADGGSVLLTARAAKGVIDQIINTDGLISATTVSGQNGRIVLSGGDAGRVAIAGRVDASAAAGGTGGIVMATGEHIAVAAGTRIDASGRDGGGEIALGSTGLTNTAQPFADKSNSVFVAAGAVLAADAAGQGNGGNVTLWSTDQTVFNGRISARGGAHGGDGGFAEVSSQKNIGITGDVDLSAAKGKTGTFLIDPTDLRITDTASGGTQDGNAADGSVGAGDANQGAGATLNTISRGRLESLSGNANIVLQATGQITIDAMAGGVINFQTVAGRGVTLQSTQTGGIRFVDANTELRTQGGAITLEALGLGSTLSNIGRLSTNGGAVTLRAAGNIQIGGAINAGAGAVQMVSTVGAITNAGATAPLVSGSSVSLTAAGGAIGAAGSAISTHTARLALEAGGSIHAASDMALTDLSVKALHVASGTHTYRVDASGLSFTLTDGSVLSAAQIAQAGLNLTLLSDRGIELGTLDIGSGTLTVTSTAGNITGATTNLSTAASVVLTARGSTGNNGAIGTAAQAINTDTPRLSATSGSGGAFLANNTALNLALLSSTGASTVTSAGTLTAGSVSTGSAALTLRSTGGSVLDDGDAATRIDAGQLTLNAAGTIGASGNRLQTSATTLIANAAVGGIHAHTTAASASLSSITSGNGAIDITAAGHAVLGAITSSTSGPATGITLAAGGSLTVNGSIQAGSAGTVSLAAPSGNISGTGLISGDRLVARALGSISLSSAASRLDLEAGSNISVNQAGRLTLENVASSGSSISVTSSSGDIVVGQVRSSTSGTISLTANAGALVDDGDAATRVVARTTTLKSDRAIGTAANPLQLSTTGLLVDSTGHLFVSNVDGTLTSLSITNRHATPGVANTLQITSPYLTFDVTDDGSRYMLNRIVGAPLNSLSFTGDQGAVIGQVHAPSAQVSLTASQGHLVEDANAQTRVTGSSVSLSALKGHVGSALAPLEVNTTQLTLAAQGELYVNSLADLGTLRITSTHADATSVHGMLVKAPSLAFSVTDSAAGHLLQQVVDTSGLTFSFTSDRSITLGQIDLSYSGSASLTSTGGSILDDGDKTTRLLANSVTLSGQALGASGSAHLDLSSSTLQATASAGGIYVDVPTATGGNSTNTFSLQYLSAAGPVEIATHEGDLSIGSTLEATNQAVRLTAHRGSILSGGGFIYLGNGSLTLNAAGSIGASSSGLNLSANGALLNAQAGTGISVMSYGTLRLGTVSATPSGAVSVTASYGSLLDDGNAATGITGSQVTLSAAGGALGGTGAALSVSSPRLSLTAADTVVVDNSATLTELSLARIGSTPRAIGITAGGGQSFSISESSGSHTLSTVSSASPLAFSFTGQGAVNLGSIAVGAGGSASVTSTGGNIAAAASGASITAGTVVLAAGTSGSIGSSAAAVALNGTTDLSVTAGRDMYVNADTALTRLSVNSTNTTTAAATASQFGLNAAGQTFTITDAGLTQSLNVGGTALGDFSFTSRKNVEVGAITASGAVSLSTSGGGANSNITSDGGTGRISAGSVTLQAASTTSGGGNIGSFARAVRVATPSLTLDGSGNMHVDSSQDLAKLDMTVTHGTNTTFAYNVAAGNIGLAITDGNAQSLALTSTGSIDFRYSVDRALSLGVVDAGTSSTGAVTLISRSAPSGTNAQINRNSGSITAGRVSLSAVGTNGGVGAGSTLSLSTQQLAVASGGNVSISNAQTLQALELDLRHRTSGASTHNYAISATGLTFSLSDSTDANGLRLNNISQSGLNLSLKADRTMTVGTVNTGAGSVTLASTNSSGLANGTIYGNSGASAASPSIVGGHLTLNAGNVYTYNNSGTPLYTSVGTFSSNITNTLNLSNNKTLTLQNNTVGGSARVEATVGSLLQGTGGLFSAPTLSLTAADAVGATGAGIVQTNARLLTLSAGRDIVVNNTTDLFGLDITSTHAAPGTRNTVAVTADRLDLALTDAAAGNLYTLERITDASGINFRLRTDVDLVVGAADVKPGHSLTLESVGTAGTSITNNGSSTLKGRSIVLRATGSVGGAGASTTRMQTDAYRLTVETRANAYLDNARDLLDLSFTSTQNVGGTAPVYSVTAPALTFDVTSDGTTTTVNQLRDTTGLNFALSTLQSQVIGVVDVQKTGTAALLTYRGLTGSSDAGQRITAASTTLSTVAQGGGTGGAIGTSGNPIRLTSPLLTLNTSGSVNIESDTHIDRLAMFATHPVVNSSTYVIQSVPVHGGAAYTLLSGSDSSTGSVLTSLNDAEGLVFSFDSDRAITVGDLNLGTTGTVTLSNRSSGGILGDGVVGTQVRAASLQMTSAGTVGAAGTGNSIEATVNALGASSNGGGTYLNLHGRTSLSSMSATGAINLVNDVGDIALGSINANGNAVNIDNQGGSILSGQLSNTSSVTLKAQGSIGNQSTVSLTGGSITLEAQATAANGAAGSIDIGASGTLTATSVTAPGTVKLSGTTLNLGTVSGGGAVTLTATQGSINGTSSSNLVTGGSVGFSAMNAGSIGSGTRLNVNTTSLSLSAPGSIFVTGLSDLAALSIDRSTYSGSASGGTLSVLAPNLTLAATDAGNVTTLTTLTDSTGLDFSYQAIGRIAVGTVNVGSTGSVTLRSSLYNDSGAITAVNGSSRITAGKAALTAVGTGSSIGTSGQTLGLAVGALTATAGNGGVYLTQAGSLDLSNVTSAGDLWATASTGDLTLGAMTFGSAHTLRLTAGTGSIYAGSGTLVGGSAASGIHLTAANGIGTALAPVVVNGSSGSSVSATVTGTGSLHLHSTGTLNGGLTSAVNNGATHITSAGSMLLTSVTSATDAVGNDINVKATAGNITVANVSAGANARHSNVNLSANAGSLLATGAGTVSGYGLNLFGASGVGTTANRLVLSGQRVQVETSGGAAFLGTGAASVLTNVATRGGQINVSTSHDLLLANASSGGGAITVSTGAGTLTAGNVNAGSGNVTLSASTSGGSVQDDGSLLTRIVGNAVSITGERGVGSATTALQTTANTLTLASNAGGAGIFVDDNNASGVTLASVYGRGPVVINAAGPLTATSVTASTDAAGNHVTLTTSSGDITVGSVSAGSTHGAVTLNAAGAIVASGTGTHVTANAVQISANGNVGTVTNTATGAGAPLKIAASSLDKLAVAGGNRVLNLSVTTPGTLTLGAAALTLGTGSSLYLQSSGGLDFSAVTLPGDANLLLNAGTTLTLPGAGLSTTGWLNLTGTQDVIAAGAASRTLTLAGSSVLLRSGALGGSTALTTTTGALDAALSGAGSLTVNNTGALSAQVSTSNGDLSVTSSGALTVTGATAAGTPGSGQRSLALTSGSGDLTLNGNVNATSAGLVTMNSTLGGIVRQSGSLTAGALAMNTVQAIGSAAAPLQVGAMQVAAHVSGTGGIHLNSTGALNTSALSTTDGSIMLTAVGDITSATSITAGGSNAAVNLTSTGGNITLRHGINSTGTGSSLLLKGATITLEGASYNTLGTQRYDGAVLLAAGGQAVSLSGAGVEFTGALNSRNASAQHLTVNGGSGTVRFTGAVGSAYVLGNLVVNTSSQTRFDGTVNAASITTDAPGTVSINGGSMFTSGAQSYGELVTLGANTTLTGSAVTLAGGADGDVAGRTLTVNGNLVAGGTLGGTTALGAVSVSGTSALAGAVTTSAGQYYQGAVTLTGDTTLTGVGVVFDGTVDGGHALTVHAGTGRAQFGGAVGGNTRLGALVVNSDGATSFNAAVTAASVTTDAAGSLSINGGSVNTTGTQTYGELVYLPGHTTLTGSTVTLSKGALGVDHDPNLNIVGNLVSGAALGALGRFGNISVTGSSTLNGAVSSAGTQTYTGLVTLGSDTVIVGRGIGFLGGLAGSNALSVRGGSGDVNFAGPIGSDTARFGSILVEASGATTFGGPVVATQVTTDAGGTLAINGGSINTTGLQSYGEHAVLGANTTLTADYVTLAGGADGDVAGRSLSIVGNLGSGGALGGQRSFGELAISGTATLSGATVTTGAQHYGGALTLAGDTTLTGNGINLAGTVNGAHALTLNAGSGNATLSGSIGAHTRLGDLVINSSGSTQLNGLIHAASVTTDAAGTLILNTSGVNTTGAQTYGERAQVWDSVTLTGSTVTLTQGADSAPAGNSLTVAGQLVTGAALGSNGAFRNVHVSGSSTLRGDVISSSAQHYGGDVTLAADTTLQGQGVTLAGKVNGNQALTINAGGGNVTVAGAIGDAARLGALRINSQGAVMLHGAITAASVTTDAGGTLAINGGAVNTTGAQSYGERVSFGANTVLNGTTVALNQGADSRPAGHDLTVNGGFSSGAALGTHGEFRNVNVAGSSTLGGGVASTGTQQYGGDVTLAADTTLQGNGVTLAGKVNGAHGLTINAGAGNVTVAGAIGDAARLGALVINSQGAVVLNGAITAASVTTDTGGTLALNGGSVNTTGAQSYGERVSFGAHTVLTGTTVALNHGADSRPASHDLTVNGNLSAGAALGTNGGFRNVAVSGTSTLAGGIASSGTQQYGGNVTLAGDSTLQGHGISFNGSVNGGHDLTVHGGTGNVTFHGAIGDSQRLGELVVSTAGVGQFNAPVTAASIYTTAGGSTVLNGGRIDTTGAQTYLDRVQLGADTTINAGDSLQFADTVNGGHALTVNAGSAYFNSALGGSERLGALLINSQGPVAMSGAITAASLTTDAGGTLAISGGAVNTTGAQSYGERVAFGASTVLTGTTVALNRGADSSPAGHDLTVNGNFSTGAALGTYGEFRNVNVAGSSTLGGGVASTGTQQYGGDVTLAADTTLKGNGVTLIGKVNGAHGLTINAGAGDVTVAGAIGDTARLGALVINSQGAVALNGAVTAASLTTDGGGTLALNGGSVNTTGAQSYGERVSFGASTVLTGTTVALNQGADSSPAGSDLAVNGNLTTGAALGTNGEFRNVSVSGTSTLGGGVASAGTQSYTGAVTTTGDATLHSRGGSLLFGSSVNGPAANTLTLRADAGDIDVIGAVSVGSLVSRADAGDTHFHGALTAANPGGLNLSSVNFVFDGAVTASTGPLVINNATSAGRVDFAAGAAVQAALGFTQTGGSVIYLPSLVNVSGGPISMAAIAYLPAGVAALSANGDITLTGLIGADSTATIAAGPTGVVRIGRDDASADHKLNLASLTLTSAGSAQLFGTLGGRTGAMAGAGVSGGLMGAPYYINGTPIGPVAQIATLAAVTAPRTVVASMPGVAALFTGNFSTSALSPHALDAFRDPNVLTVSQALSQAPLWLPTERERRPAGNR